MKQLKALNGQYPARMATWQAKKIHAPVMLISHDLLYSTVKTELNETINLWPHKTFLTCGLSTALLSESQLGSMFLFFYLHARLFLKGL